MAANTFAQTPTSASGSGVLSLSKTFASSCTNGSKLVAAVSSENETATHTVSDNGNSGNYTQDVEAHNTGDGTGHGRASVHSISNTQTSALQVTVTFGSSSDAFLQTYEITNSGGTPAFDSSGNSVDDDGGVMSISVVTTKANCTMIGAVGPHFPGGVAGTDTGYTLRFGETALVFSYHQGEDDVDVGAAGTQTLTWNSYSSDDGTGHAVVAAAYAPPSDGGPDNFRNVSPLFIMGMG